MNRRTKNVYEFGPFRLDTEEHLLLRNGETVPLKPKVFELLSTLVQYGGHLLTKTELMHLLWPDRVVEEHSLVVCVFELRKALTEDCQHPYIQTVPRRGYRFVSDVRKVQDAFNELDTEEYSLSGTHHERESEETGIESIGILPFSFMGKDVDDSYLGVGLADALITKLGNLRQIIVRPTSAIRKYVSREQDPLAAGRELKVTAILDGSIRRSGGRLRVTVQLISTREGATLWADKFDEEFTNIFAIEDSISRQVARALTLKLTGEERKSLTHRHTDSTRAYQMYLKGQFFFSKKTPLGLKKAVKYFEQAIRIDSRYALAYVGLSASFICLVDLNVLSPGESFPKAKDYLQVALCIDERLGEAHSILGRLHMYEWNFAAAEERYKRAIEISPNPSLAHLQYSALLRHFGRFNEALAHIRRAQELDPVSLLNYVGVCTALYFSRQYDRAIKEGRKALELDMDFPIIHYVLGLSYEKLGQYQKALTEYQRSNSFFNDDNPEMLASLGRVLALSGEISKSRPLLNRLIRRSQRKYVSPYYIASIYVSLGENDEAFEWLQKAYEERDYELCLMKVDPRLDPLHDDPRFLVLLQRVGLN